MPAGPWRVMKWQYSCCRCHTGSRTTQNFLKVPRKRAWTSRCASCAVMCTHVRATVAGIDKSGCMIKSGSKGALF
eukprot:1160595-Pelagomonas_calceolata.AAC.8